RLRYRAICRPTLPRRRPPDRDCALLGAHEPPHLPYDPGHRRGWENAAQWSEAGARRRRPQRCRRSLPKRSSHPPALQWLPALERGSVQFMPVYPGDPTTPGIASVPNLREGLRLAGKQLQHDLPTIPVDPRSSADAAPILRGLAGAAAPHDWQGGLTFEYHVG